MKMYSAKIKLAEQCRTLSLWVHSSPWRHASFVLSEWTPELHTPISSTGPWMDEWRWLSTTTFVRKRTSWTSCLRLRLGGWILWCSFVRDDILFTQWAVTDYHRSWRKQRMECTLETTPLDLMVQNQLHWMIYA